jgi:hypothetical protein
MSGITYTTLSVTRILHETQDAFRVLLAGREEGEEVWIPKSMIEDAECYVDGDENCEMNVATWFAKKEELV